jgi:voltage-gated sodium channel
MVLIATFTMLNLFIAIIVNAMHSFTEAEAQEAMDAVSEARDHIEADLHQEMAALRQEINELKVMLKLALDTD